MSLTSVVASYPQPKASARKPVQLPAEALKSLQEDERSTDGGCTSLSDYEEASSSAEPTGESAPGVSARDGYHYQRLQALLEQDGVSSKETGSLSQQPVLKIFAGSPRRRLRARGQQVMSMLPTSEQPLTEIAAAPNVSAQGPLPNVSAQGPLLLTTPVRATPVRATPVRQQQVPQVGGMVTSPPSGLSVPPPPGLNLLSRPDLCSPRDQSETTLGKSPSPTTDVLKPTKVTGYPQPPKALDPTLPAKKRPLCGKIFEGIDAALRAKKLDPNLPLKRHISDFLKADLVFTV